MPFRTPPLLLIALALASAAPAQPPAAVDGPSDEEKPVVQALAVQQAMSQGRALLRAGHAREAVAALEKELPRIDGNPHYLTLLRDAYVAYIKELQIQRQTERVAVYQRKLRILDPNTETGSSDSPPPAAVAADPPAMLAPPQPMPSPAAPAPPPATLPTEPVPVNAAEAARPDRRVRAKGEEDDPFHQVPADQSRSAAELLTQATAAFQHEEYAKAGRLYRQAAQADPAAVAAHADQIAYCRMDQVVQQLNRLPPGTPAPAELEREAAEALRQSPRLEAIGRKVLAEIQKRKAGGAGAGTGAAEPSVAGWTVVDSANFRVCHQGTPDLATQVSRLAEQTRQAMFARWFGAAGEDWSPRCTVFLHPDAAAYSQATGKPMTSPGHATIQAQGTRVVSRRLDLHCDDLNLLPATLPHEATHVVLADLFSDEGLPRWADEGMAVQAESPGHRERYQRAIARFAHEGRLIPVGDLMQRPDLPTDPAAATAFFVQSVSLVEFLVAQKGPQAFALFLRESPRRGYATCLQRHFGYRDMADLQAQWQRHVLGEARAAAGDGAQ